MDFSEEILEKIQEAPILLDGESIELHELGQDVFELAVAGKSILLSTDAGLDLAYQLAEFLSAMEHRGS